MGTLGLGSSSDPGGVDALQRNWNAAVEGDMRVMDARQEMLKGVADGVATAVRGPVWIVARCAIVVALAVVGLLAVEIVRVAGVTRTCEIVLPSNMEQPR